MSELQRSLTAHPDTLTWSRRLEIFKFEPACNLPEFMKKMSDMHCWKPKFPGCRCARRDLRRLSREIPPLGRCMSDLFFAILSIWSSQDISQISKQSCEEACVRSYSQCCGFPCQLILEGVPRARHRLSFTKQQLREQLLAAERSMKIQQKVHHDQCHAQVERIDAF